MKNKRMKAIDEDAASAPNNPKEEGLEMALPQKDSAMSHGETLAMASGEQTPKKEVTGTSHEAGNSVDLKSDTSIHGGNGRSNASLTKTDKAEGRVRDTVGRQSTDDEINTFAYSAKGREVKGTPGEKTDGGNSSPNVTKCYIPRQELRGTPQEAKYWTPSDLPTNI